MDGLKEVFQNFAINSICNLSANLYREYKTKFAGGSPEFSSFSPLLFTLPLQKDRFRSANRLLLLQPRRPPVAALSVGTQIGTEMAFQLVRLSSGTLRRLSKNAHQVFKSVIFVTHSESCAQRCNERQQRMVSAVEGRTTKFL